jgi:hypothetical protein
MYNVTDTYSTLISSPVRYTGVYGAVRLKDGTMIQLDDSNIDSGTLQIINKLNRRGDFRPGGVYSGELSVGLRGFAGKTSDLDGAVIKLAFRIYHDSSMKAAASESVPLGRYYVDGSTIKRRNDVVKFSADDALVLFDIPSTSREGTLFELVDYACTAAGVTFGMSQSEFEALPNGAMSASIDVTRVQTEHDLLMYVGMLTASFARIRRQDGALEFRPLTCNKNSGGVITPEREIKGDIRFSTDFSDDTTRIAQIITRKKGNIVSSSLSATAGGSEKLAVLELDDNPLTAALTDAELVEALNNELRQLFECLNRVYDVSFTGDPALDVGDYVRLRGGAIDTERGYATGMITSQTWRYRGQHSIKCSMPSSLTALSDSSAVMLALDGETASDDTAASEKPIRIQPRSQLQKQIDGLAGMIGESGGVAEKLQGANSEYYATTTPSGFRISKSGSDTYEEHICYITDNYDMYNSLVIGDTGGNSIRFLKDYAGFSIESRNNSLTIDENASACVNLNFSNGFSILMRYDKSDGSTKILCGENSLTLKSDGLYYNGTKIG